MDLRFVTFQIRDLRFVATESKILSLADGLGWAKRRGT